MTGVTKGILDSFYIAWLRISALSANLITVGMMILICSSFCRILQSQQIFHLILEVGLPPPTQLSKADFFCVIIASFSIHHNFTSKLYLLALIMDDHFNIAKATLICPDDLSWLCCLTTIETVSDGLCDTTPYLGHSSSLSSITVALCWPISQCAHYINPLKMIKMWRVWAVINQNAYIVFQHLLVLL